MKIPVSHILCLFKENNVVQYNIMKKIPKKRISVFLLAILLAMSAAGRQLCYALNEEEETILLTDVSDADVYDNQASELELKSEPELKSKIEPEPELVQNPETEPESEPKQEPESESDKEPEAKADSAPELETEPVPEPEVPSETTSLTVSIEWIDGDNYYEYRPGAVTFKIQRVFFPKPVENLSEVGRISL